MRDTLTPQALKMVIQTRSSEIGLIYRSVRGSH